jgi:hypothetical protein
MRNKPQEPFEGGRGIEERDLYSAESRFVVAEISCEGTVADADGQRPSFEKRSNEMTVPTSGEDSPLARRTRTVSHRWYYLLRRGEKSPKLGQVRTDGRVARATGRPSPPGGAAAPKLREPF